MQAQIDDNAEVETFGTVKVTLGCSPELQISIDHTCIVIDRVFNDGTRKRLQTIEMPAFGSDVAECYCEEHIHVSDPECEACSDEQRHQFTKADWMHEVAHGDTRLGYDEWVMHQAEAAAYDQRKSQ